MADAISPRARSPLDSWHRAHGARFADSGEWALPLSYGSTEQEVAAVRSGCGLIDLSAFARLRITGRSVSEVVESLGAVAARQVQGAAVLDGGLLACRLAVDALLLLGGSPDGQRVRDRVASSKVIVTDATSALACFCLVGPAVDQLLPKVTTLDPKQLTRGRCAETAVAGVATLLVRVDDLSVPSVHVCVARDLAEYLWGRLVEVGREWKLILVGVEGYRSLAVENASAVGSLPP